MFFINLNMCLLSYISIGFINEILLYILQLHFFFKFMRPLQISITLHFYLYSIFITISITCFSYFYYIFLYSITQLEKQIELDGFCVRATL